MVRTWCFLCHGPGSIPGQETKIPQAVLHGQKIKIKKRLKKNKQKKPLHQEPCLTFGLFHKEPKKEK